MQRRLLLAAALLLCATVHAQDTPSNATNDTANADAQAKPDGAVAPEHFGYPTCQNMLPGCKECVLYYVGGAKAASAPPDNLLLNTTAAVNFTAVAATPEGFARKVYVCKECFPGFMLSGSGNMNDPMPRFCIPEGGPAPTPACPPSPGVYPNSAGFKLPCPTAPGSVCTAGCAANAFGTGLQAICIVTPGTNMATWEITGSCSTGIPVCPPTPPPGAATNSRYFQNCANNIGATCSAGCAAGATGPGYTATCKQGAPTKSTSPGAPAAGWVIEGACNPPAISVRACQNNCGRKNLVDEQTQEPCYCDYWCNLYNDCCGGMNAAAAAAKDAACPAMAPEADNLATVLTCSNRRGVLHGVGSCASYRPGNCWCDKYCSDAGDCCDNCPTRCHATCPARSRTEVVGAVHSTGLASPRHICGTDDLSKLARKAKAALLGSMSLANFSYSLENRIQRCQDALIQTGPTTSITIPTYLANIGVGNVTGQYTADRAAQLMDYVNAAYARSGFHFDPVKYVDNFTFSSNITSDGLDCLDPVNPNCERCRVYRQIVPANLQGSKVLVVYLQPDGVAARLGLATFPWDMYNPSPTSNTIATSCADGVRITTFSATDVGSLVAVKKDAATLAHEIGHWLGLKHTWNMNISSTDTALCEEAAGPGANKPRNIGEDLSDGVRDTPPQLANRTSNDGLNFGCDADGSFNPKNASQGPALACNGQQPTGGRYYNNFNNFMSYFSGTCDAGEHSKTFSAGQIARTRCVWSCYRDNQCGSGSFYSS